MEPPFNANDNYNLKFNVEFSSLLNCAYSYELNWKVNPCMNI